MSVVGHQDYWTAGSRFYYKKDNDGSTEFPWVDLGTILSANPTSEISKLTLKDGDGGRLTTVDESVTEIAESYDITCNNLNLRNLSLLFLGSEPASFTQSAASKAISAKIFTNEILKLHDTDTDKTPLYAIQVFEGIVDDITNLTVGTDILTDIVVSTKTLTVSTDLTTHLSPGDSIIVKAAGLTNALNAGTYTVASVTATTIVVNETLVADDTGVTVDIVYAASGDTGTVYAKTTDWEVSSLDRGIIKIPATSNIVDASDNDVYFYTGAVSGNRLVLPQAAAGAINGKFEIWWSRGGNTDQTVRMGTCSITPSSSTIQVEDYSQMVLAVNVLSDLTETEPAGRLLAIKGTLPTY